MMHYYGGHHGLFGYGWFFQLLVLALFLGVVWWLLRNQQQYGLRASGTPEEILDRRLASGEIDTTEYRKLKKELS